MSINNHSMEGSFPYKMDAKGRVSLHSDWRAEIGNEQLRLMRSTNEKLPTLRVLTEDEFEGMQRDIKSLDWSPAKKRNALGLLFERVMRTKLNDQGKLSIPKPLCEAVDAVAGDALQLIGRGGYIEIINKENYEKLQVEVEASIEDINEELGFF